MTTDDEGLAIKTTQICHAMCVMSAPSGFILEYRLSDGLDSNDIAESLINLFTTRGKPDQIWIQGGGVPAANIIIILAESLRIRYKISPFESQNTVAENRDRFINDRFPHNKIDDCSGATFSDRPEEIAAIWHVNEAQVILDKICFQHNNCISNETDEKPPIDFFEEFDNTAPLTEDEADLLAGWGLTRADDT